jgi:hypothetical protein
LSPCFIAYRAAENILRRPLLIRATLLGDRLRQQCHQLIDRPYMPAQASLHRWRYAQRLVDAAEVVMHEMQRNRRPE